jgi:ornithine cyclodeaminase/alanine dehydrogenase-like protein (mu-crystallin family)
MMLRILSGNDVRRAITMAEAIQAVKEAYAQLSAGQAVVPLRTPVEVEKREAVTLFMPAYLTQSDALGAKIAVAGSPAQAAGAADVICTATTSSRPVFDDADLKPGTHINGVGSYTPEMQEVPAETVARAKIVVDSRTASLAEAGDLIIPMEKGLITAADIHGEIGEIAEGKISGRSSAQEVTFFKSVGVAVQDVSVAELVLRRAVELDLGVQVAL